MFKFKKACLNDMPSDYNRQQEIFLSNKKIMLKVYFKSSTDGIKTTFFWISHVCDETLPRQDPGAQTGVSPASSCVPWHHILHI